MTGVDKIINKILDDAKKEREQITNSAVDGALAKKAKAQETADEKTRAILKKAEADAAEIKSRARLNAQMLIRQKQLAAKQAVIKKTYEKAYETLCQKKGAELLDLMVSLINSIPHEEKLAVVMSAKTKSKLGKQIDQLTQKLGERVDISREARDMEDGFLLASQDSEINFTFSALLGAKKEMLESEVLKILFS